MNNRLHKSFITLYFKTFNSEQRNYFVQTNSDRELVSIIDRLTNLFIEYPFYHYVIFDRTKDIGKFKDITRWQRAFYLTVYREHSNFFKNKRTESNFSEVNQVYQLLESKNSSFQFLIRLNKTFQNESPESKIDFSILSDIITFVISENWSTDYIDVMKLRSRIERLKLKIDQNSLSSFLSNNTKSLTKELEESETKLADVFNRIADPFPTLTEIETIEIEKQAQATLTEIKLRVKDDLQ